VVRPVIDRNRCEAKAACVAVCPYQVFAIGPLSPEDRARLSLRGRIKAFFHGHRQALVVRADDCHACGRCVPACPEGAISLERLPKTPAP
jgi:NAD-dependent dihydropyrimidine dehydrogenase PreA subunit